MNSRDAQKQMILKDNLWKVMLKISWPAVVAMVLYGLNTVFDAIFVGRFVGVYSINGIESVLNIKDCHLHLYGKSESHYLRKIGHITALGSSGKAASAKAKKALESIKTKFIGEYL